MKLHIAVLPGDGIGPEVTAQAVKVLNTPHPTEEAIQAAADVINAQADRLQAASDNDSNTVSE